jgi:hypothetical protein
MLAVLVTQYDTAGGGHVGGRYFVIGLPLIAPAAVLGWSRLVEHRDRRARRWVLTLLLVAALSTTLQGALALRDQRQLADDFVSHIAAVRSEVGSDSGPAPVLVTHGAGSRYAWEIADEGVWLATPNEHLDRYSARLAALGESVVLFTADPEHDEPVLERRWNVEWRSDLVAVLSPR